MADSVRTRVLAALVALALPASFYVYGDVVDAFPGPLTLRAEAAGPVEGVPADGEAYALLSPSADASASPAVTPVSAADLNAALAPVAALPVVEGHLAYAIVDADSGEVIAESDASEARTPASTMKLLTALSAIRAFDADQTFTTSATLEGSHVSLVGGGDMLLARGYGETREGVSRASLAELADLTATAAQQAGLSEVTLGVDDTYFAHDPLNPAWGSNGPAGGWVAPIMALGVDGGRLDGSAYGRKSEDPAMDAGRIFAELLAQRGVSVNGEVARQPSGPAAQNVGSVSSAPLSDWIEHTLLYSDNTVAELLARHVAKQKGQPSTVQGARDAVSADLTSLAAAEGFAVDGLVIADNSGLSVDNRVAPQFLAHLCAWAAGGAPPEVRAVFAMVPVGALTGTLTERFEEDGAEAGRGIVRGKTGYLGGVASLAGTAVLADGRTVGYSILVHGFEGSEASAARAAVDQAATAMVTAGAAAEAAPAEDAQETSAPGLTPTGP
ncbi:MAG: D-alanyl-D-alanine carboxypeptidase [Dermabacter sp.]|nr:D-alanyl-D-alanine carboxypeptidase [Dermabacter sp.]